MPDPPAVAPVAAHPEAAPSQLPAPSASPQASPAFGPSTPTPAPRSAPPPPIGQRWLRMALGEDRYAVELLRVQEVVRLAPIIAVRGAPPSLLGVMNLRGRVVPVHDLGLWLHRPPATVDDRARIVVLEHQDELVGLLVSAVTDVVTLEAAHIEPPAVNLRDRASMGIARTPGAPPTVMLDATAVFE
nr:chemotaxis protein CheW [Thermomonas alba]